MPRPASRTSSRDGFSLLEALVVLAVTGLTLTLVFGLVNGTAASGFRLGRRATSAADARIGADAFRAVLSGMGVPAFGGRGGVGPGFAGTATEITGESAPGRFTACGGPGPIAPLILSLAKAEDGRTLLTCAAAGAEARAVLADLGPSGAAFEYSADGRRWGGEIDLRGGPAQGEARERRLWVRLRSGDGRTAWVERLVSPPTAAAR